MSVRDRTRWAEEQARLHHNLLSLREALRDREAQAEADEVATSSRLKAARDDGNRSAREAASLREMVDSLRVELAEALVSASAASAAVAGRRVDVSGGGGEQAGLTSVVASAGGEVLSAKEDYERVRVDGARSEQGAGEGAQARDPATREGDGEGSDDDGERSVVTLGETGGKAEDEGYRRRHSYTSGGGGGGGGGTGGDGSNGAAAATGARDRWPDEGFEGTIGECCVPFCTRRGFTLSLLRLYWRVAVESIDTPSQVWCVLASSRFDYSYGNGVVGRVWGRLHCSRLLRPCSSRPPHGKGLTIAAAGHLLFTTAVPASICTFALAT